MSLTSGKPVPSFSLLNQSGETISLSDFKGKTLVLYFYPKASTPGCTVQACSLRDEMAELKKLNAEVVAISPDPVKNIAKFVDKQSLNFNLLSDEDHSVAEAYGVWQLKKFMGREFMGIIRTTFIIDEKGCLIEQLPKFTTKNHHEVLLNYLKAL